MKRRLIGLAGCLSLLIAQETGFGVRGGLTFYQYRTPYAQFFARIGGELGATGRIPLFTSRKTQLHHSLQPAFGYLMGHSRLFIDSSIYISSLTGRPLPSTADAHTYTHFLYMQVLWRISFDREEAFGLAAGLQVLRSMGQTLLIEYETPDGQPIQEWNSVSLTDLRRILPPWILNGCLYADIRFYKGMRSEWLLHIQTIHQANRFFWPTGLLLGATWLYIGANTL